MAEKISLGARVDQACIENLEWLEKHLHATLGTELSRASIIEMCVKHMVTAEKRKLVAEAAKTAAAKKK